MFNKSTFVTLFALFLLGSLTYTIKQKVIELDNDLAQVHRNIAHYQESMHILNAEWAYLTRPSRLQALVEEHTGLQHCPGVSLVSYEEVFQQDDELYQAQESLESSVRLASMRR
ncbi:MAG: hypothetical protein GW748_02820 [Alphaproteobacteria bacterium]|nr:hypothetical protein [Alphaproteobacteria bacterium]NCQ66659.1 hypothetical protein [Alphaproteobacteria bacterium]NCT07110.1 hypothetical protein [Alphaproteobacteria bacterium]